MGIVGCGRAARDLHLPALRQIAARVRAVAVADIDEALRRQAGAISGINRMYPDLAAMLDSAGDQIDAVAVLVPALAHAEVVCAALDAGKHVLVEKPLAVTLEDAGRMIDRAARAPQLRVAVGFNLRQHRLARKAKALIESGALGDLKLVRTAWTSGIRQRMQVPGWRDRRATGGGAIYEIAVHHIDLLRFLTGAEIAEVFVASTHGQGDDESVALTMRLSSGTPASCVFSERATDANEIEIFGSRARARFSLYRFSSFTLIPAGKYGGGVGRVTDLIRELPTIWPIARRGGDFAETYRREWLAFAESIHNGGPVPATIEDGIEALRVVLAAAESARTGNPVATSQAPASPSPSR